ncbi:MULTISPECIES: TIGR04222 domain-containing membrane protein [Streptomyces]|uniref:TIGR04222 domain-containing membrane protein n=1 Tax=Streptomyces olivaceiscleroticus TaxID=68245 RepID=A0ABN1A9W4_9ACTN|nr:TIGR04222 domain-containing membrane protein [Streptomyces niger]
MSFAQLVYLAVAASSVVLIAGTVHTRRASPSPRTDLVDVPSHDLWENAFLAGGPGRVADAAIAGMHGDGRLAIGGPGTVSARRPAVSHDTVESAVLEALARTPGGSLARLRPTVMRSGAVQQIGDRLADRGLLRRPEAGRPWRQLARLQIGACMGIFFLGIFQSVTGALDDGAPQYPQNMPFVLKVTPAVFAGIFIGTLCRNAVRRRITKDGKRALKRFRTANKAAATGPAAMPALAVAIGGAALLTDRALREHLLEAQRAARGPAAASAVSASGAASGAGWSAAGDAGGLWCGSSGGGTGCGNSSCGGSASGTGGSSCGGSSSGGSSSCGGGSS